MHCSIGTGSGKTRENVDLTLPRPFRKAAGLAEDLV